MIDLWVYHCRHGRAVQMLYLMAKFDRVVGADVMRAARSARWSDEMAHNDAMTMRMRP